MQIFLFTCFDFLIFYKNVTFVTYFTYCLFQFRENSFSKLKRIHLKKAKQPNLYQFEFLEFLQALANIIIASSSSQINVGSADSKIIFCQRSPFSLLKDHLFSLVQFYCILSSCVN